MPAGNSAGLWEKGEALKNGYPKLGSGNPIEKSGGDIKIGDGNFLGFDMPPEKSSGQHFFQGYIQALRAVYGPFGSWLKSSGKQLNKNF